MEPNQTPQSAETTTYSFIPESDERQSAQSDVIDLTNLQTTNGVNEQAATATVMRQNSLSAEAIAVDAGWEYALLRSNDREDDAGEVNGAAADAANARCFVNLFRESFQEFSRSAEYGKLLIGEQAKWRPSLRDANGRLIGAFDHVLLNPTLPQLGNRPVVQIILPNRDYLAEVASRLKPEQQQALERGQPIAFLERRTKLEDDVMIQSLMKMMTAPTADQRQRISQAVTEYRQAQATHKPEEIAGLQQSFQNTIRMTLGLAGSRYDTLLDKMLEVNQLYRVTYHPDINVLGRQPIHQQTVPLQYKGVELQPAQIKNLLLGNAIEVTGLRDERRAGLYRATVQFNVLHNKVEESTKREELKTDNKAEFVRHQQAVHQRGSDQLLRSPKDTVTDKERSVNDQQPPKQRPAFRAGR